MKTEKNQTGVSIIAAIFITVILAFMGVMFVSLINTSTYTSVNDLQSTRAFYVAEGGVEFILRNRSFPNYSMGAAWLPLGQGNFNVTAPAYLTNGVNIGNTTINVNSTTAFANPPGKIVIDSEVMTYTAVGAGSFTIAPAAVQTHDNGNSVYPVTTVTADPGLANPATINVASTTGFSIPGIINIESENVYCTGTNGTTQFTNCTRAYNGTTAAAHTAGRNVFQYVFISTGIVPNEAERVVRADMTSRIRNSEMGWSWAPSKDWVLGAASLKPVAGSAIAFDASSNADFRKTDAPPFQWSHTVGGGANRFLYVGLSIGYVVALNPATNITYAGQALTYLGSRSHANGTIRVEIWYLSNPPTGANNVVVTIPAGNEFIGGSASFTGVDQAKPIDAPINFAQGVGSAASINVILTSPNSFVIDALSQVATPNTSPGASQSAEWQNIKVGGTLGAGSYQGPLFSGAAGNTMKVTINEIFQ